MYQEEDWAPGWLAIEESFEKLYPNQKPQHFGTIFPKRAIFGGDQYLDGYSIYRSPQGFCHIVTFGMSELYTNEESFGGEYSKWGYEMTLKLPIAPDSDYLWALDLLANLARYTFTQKRFFEPYQFFPGNENPIKNGSDSLLTGLLLIEDPDLPAIQTLHGKVEFIQLFGITKEESAFIAAEPDQASFLASTIATSNPHFITDLSRSSLYI